MTMDINDPDNSAIHQVASDYYGGWYEANVERIARSLHSDLAKRAIRKDDRGIGMAHSQIAIFGSNATAGSSKTIIRR
jgi:hypothetical protein